MILLDTNILVRMANHDDQDYDRTVRVVFEFRKADILAISPQTLYEFWAVATRDVSNNGLSMNGERASRWIRRYCRLFHFVDEPPTLFEKWVALVEAHNVRGFRAHDARHAALMQALGIARIMTYNVSHFAGFGVAVINPHEY